MPDLREVLAEIRECAARTDVPRLVTALTAVLDLLDEAEAARREDPREGALLPEWVRQEITDALEGGSS